MKREHNNILQVINLLSSAKSFIGDQFTFLQRLGFKLNLICSPDENLKEFTNKQNIKYKAVTLNRHFTPLQDLSSLIKICIYIKKNQIGTIIGHQAKGRLLTVLAGRIMRVPNIIIFAHGSIFETSKGLKKKLLILENQFESICSHKVVCVSRFVANARLHHLIDSPHKQYILGTGTCGGIDTQMKFNPINIVDNEKEELKIKLGIGVDDFIIGFSGRIVKDKGIVELVDAFKILTSKHPNMKIKLLFVGVFENRNSIPQTYIDTIYNNPNIIYTGYVNNIQLYYSIMSVLILPSFREGFGMSLIEASALEIPVIASKVTGCVEALVDGYTGLYINIDPLDIAQKVEQMFNLEYRTQLGINGRKWVVENFDHLKVWPHLVEVINK